MEDCQEAFDMLKAMCTSAPILDFTDFAKPFKLHTDAGTTGLDAILYQKQDGNNWVIGYASQAFSKSESHYPAHKLEFQALKWAVTKSFQEYTYGNTFPMYSDNKPLSTEADAVRAILKATVDGPEAWLEVYACHKRDISSLILESPPTWMTAAEWVQAQKQTQLLTRQSPG